MEDFVGEGAKGRRALSPFPHPPSPNPIRGKKKAG
jgi:hypothetical protein